MNNPPFSIHNLNPSLVDSVEKAFQRNVEAGRVVGDEFSGGLAKEGLIKLVWI